MEQSQREGNRHVRTEDLLDPPPIGKAMAVAGLAAVVGAVIWGLLRIYGGVEHGAVAWGIGVLIGTAIIKGGGHGQTLAIAGGVFAVIAIAAGKQISYQSEVNQTIDATVEAQAASYNSYRSAATEWIALGKEPKDDAVVDFALAHDIDVDDADQLRREYGAEFDRFVAEQPTQEQWRESARAEVEAWVAENYTFMDYLNEDFNIIDLLFIGLGIAIAFGIVHKHTVSLQVQARRELRAAREAEAEAQE